MQLVESEPAEGQYERSLVAAIRGRRVPTYVARAERNPTQLHVIEHLTLTHDTYAVAAERAACVRDAPHPRLTRVRAAIERPGGIDLVSDFIDGESLTSLLGLLRERRIPLPAMCALRIVSDVLSGLNALHRLGPFASAGHGDLSPHNIIVGLDGRVRLVEIIRGSRWVPREDGMRFVAPEIRRGEPSTPASDLHAVAVILDDLLAAEGNDPAHVAPFLEVGRRGRAEAPADRFASAAEMLSALASRFRDQPPLHADVTRLMTSAAGEAIRARRVALETAPILDPSRVRQALAIPGSMPVAYLAPEPLPGSRRPSDRPPSMEPGSRASAPSHTVTSAVPRTIPPAPLLPSFAAANAPEPARESAPLVAVPAAPRTDAVVGPASERYASVRPVAPPRSTPAQPLPDTSVIIEAEAPRPRSGPPAAPEVPSTPPPADLPPMRRQQVTSPDLTALTLAAEEREQRSPRLVLLCVTLLLVGMAVGVLWSQSRVAAPPVDAGVRTGQHP
ncbi:MAG: serine/threonine protein kinase [Labilithrix sp.]|nr:serine/threonine protein kinase [Labilithrix sp.]